MRYIITDINKFMKDAEEKLWEIIKKSAPQTSMVSGDEIIDSFNNYLRNYLKPDKNGLY